MLEGLEPSIALTGGPWYTDNELDTEFIQNLTEACYKFISDLVSISTNQNYSHGSALPSQSFPKRKEGAPGALYPISNAPQYPTAQHIRNSLRKARLTETDLTVEHVEMLLNVLVLDGKIEKVSSTPRLTPLALIQPPPQLPAFGSALWDSSAIGEDSDDDGDRRSQKKRKRHLDDEDDKRKKRKRKKHAISSDDESASDSGSRKKHRRKRAKDNSDSDDSESDEEGKKKKKKKKKKRRDIAPSSSDDGSSDSDDHKKKKKKKKVKQESSESDDEEPDLPRKRKSSKRSSSPAAAFDEYDTNSGGTVYRAIKAETIFLGWSESPCALCPSFDFCKDGGPVNPRECVYYGDWLTGGTVAVVEDML
jgi:DNA-directed RNA polymerase III subunit RPC6